MVAGNETQAKMKTITFMSIYLNKVITVELLMVLSIQPQELHIGEQDLIFQNGEDLHQKQLLLICLCRNTLVKRKIQLRKLRGVRLLDI